MKKILIIIISLFCFIKINLKAADNENQSIKVYVENIENENYYLDILFLESNEDKKNYINLDIFDKNMTNKIYDINDEFTSSIVKGSSLPFVGEIQPVKQKNLNLHTFLYDIKGSVNNKIQEAKIVVVNESGEVKKSEIIKIINFNSVIAYNYETNEFKIKDEKVNILALTIFLIICSLIIDIVLFVLFSNSDDKYLNKYGSISIIIVMIISALIANAYYRDGINFALKNLVILQIINLVIRFIATFIIFKNKKLILYSILSTFLILIFNFLLLKIV